MHRRDDLGKLDQSSLSVLIKAPGSDGGLCLSFCKISHPIDPGRYSVHEDRGGFFVFKDQMFKLSYDHQGLVVARDGFEYLERAFGLDKAILESLDHQRWCRLDRRGKFGGAFHKFVKVHQLFWSEIKLGLGIVFPGFSSCLVARRLLGYLLSYIKWHIGIAEKVPGSRESHRALLVTLG